MTNQWPEKCRETDRSGEKLNPYTYLSVSRVPNPALPRPGTKIHVRQCHQSNQRIRFYTYQATLGFGTPVLDCTPASTCRPNARSSPPLTAFQGRLIQDSFTYLMTDSRRPRPSEANVRQAPPVTQCSVSPAPCPPPSGSGVLSPHCSNCTSNELTLLGRAVRSLDVSTDNCPLCRRSSSARLGVR